MAGHRARQARHREPTRRALAAALGEPFHRAIRGASLALAALALVGAPAQADALRLADFLPQGALAPSYFDSSEIGFRDLTKFPKWLSVLARSEARAARPVLTCTLAGKGGCTIDAWSLVLWELERHEGMEQIDRLNRLINAFRYQADATNYGVSDYWATPDEFLRNGGDCEDYAIAKYFALRALGWNAQALRLVVLDDLFRKSPHALVLVEYERQVFVLDNQIARILPAQRVRGYRPIYSLNELGWWLHEVAPSAGSSSPGSPSPGSPSPGSSSPGS